MNYLIEKKRIIKYLSIFIFCIAIFSCDIKKDAIGANDDLVVLAAKEDRNDIRNLLSIVFNDTLLTPAPEPFYNVKFADPSSYEALKTQTNLIIASIGDYELNHATKLVRKLLGKKAFIQTSLNINKQTNLLPTLTNIPHQKTHHQKSKSSPINKHSHSQQTNPVAKLRRK